MNRFKIGTFNLYNLVLPNVTYYANKKYSQSDYDKKTAWISNQLKSMDLHVLMIRWSGYTRTNPL